MHRANGGENGHSRSKMTDEKLKEKGYGKRWIVESLMSGLKRTSGSGLCAHKEKSLFFKASLLVLAYALRR